MAIFLHISIVRLMLHNIAIIAGTYMYEHQPVL
jgi:hypothetical protein